ncbi:hypothetical protein EVY23_27035, partial [Citrobacter freundii]
RSSAPRQNKNSSIKTTFHTISHKSLYPHCMHSLLSVKSRALVAFTIFMRFAKIIILSLSFL